VSSAVERSDSMLGSWRKLPDGAQPTSPEQCLMAQASSDKFPECGKQGPGPKEDVDRKSAAPCKHMTGCTDFHNSSCKGLKIYV